MYRKLLCLIGCVLFLAVGCEKEPVKVKQQPITPPYTKMMLKGSVAEISYTRVRSDADTEVRSKTTYHFDEDQNVIYHEQDGIASDSFVNLTTESFWATEEADHLYDFPYLWKVYNYFKVFDGNTRTEYKWGQNDSVGIFTDIRCFIDDEPVAYEGEYNIAELLYYENGYPKHSFILEETGVTLVNKYEYSDFDHMGNPLKLIKQTPKEKIVITREITYW